jgi:hypothetical protein
MTLKQDIDREFSRLAGSTAAAGPQSLSVDAGVGRLQCSLVALDALACSFESFTLETPRLADLSIDQLKKRAETLSARLSYLLEPIGTVEVDPDACTVQMRSVPPHKDDDGTSYYELLAQRGGRLSLCRYSKAPGGVRRLVPANITREVFHRLAADFVSVV